MASSLQLSCPAILKTARSTPILLGWPRKSHSFDVYSSEISNNSKRWPRVLTWYVMPSRFFFASGSFETSSIAGKPPAAVINLQWRSWLVVWSHLRTWAQGRGSALSWKAPQSSMRTVSMPWPSREIKAGDSNSTRGPRVERARTSQPLAVASSGSPVHES